MVIAQVLAEIVVQNLPHLQLYNSTITYLQIGRVSRQNANDVGERSLALFWLTDGLCNTKMCTQEARTTDITQSNA